MHQEKIERAKILLETLPYIKKFRNRILVIKFGGSLMMDPALKKRFAYDLVLLQTIGVKVVLVHGGGKELSKWMQLFGKEISFVDGLRYTDTEGVCISEMVLSGKVNSEIVALLNKAGAKALGISGKDAELLLAKKIKSSTGKDIGFVGTVDKVNPQIIFDLLEKGYIPVVSSIGQDIKAQTLNLNADVVACALAQVVNAEKLIFVTDVDGLFIDKELKPALTITEAKKFLNHPDVSGGMIPKLSMCIEAIEGTVKQVHMINGKIEHAVLLELFTDGGIGTMLYSLNQEESANA